MVFYHGECGLRDPRTPSVSRASWARTISGSDRNRWLLILPASSSAGWKESGLSEELVHLGPTHISSLTLSIELCLRYVNKCAELTRGIHLRVIRPDRDFWGHNSLMLEECSTFHLAELICSCGNLTAEGRRRRRYTRRMDRLWTPWRYSYVTRVD